MSTRGPRVRLAPSILSADAAGLWRQVEEAVQAGADAIHIDIMDGQFVPTIAFGPLVVEALRRRTDIPLDVHMMVREPGRFVSDLANAGATGVTVHAEACAHLHRTVHQVREAGLQVGVALNPASPLSVVEEVLRDVDLVLVMTVNPGFPAQSFIPSTLPKVRRVREILDGWGLGTELEVDGGINAETAGDAVDAGARLLVAGSAVFNGRESVADALARLRRAVEGAGGL